VPRLQPLLLVEQIAEMHFERRLALQVLGLRESGVERYSTLQTPKKALPRVKLEFLSLSLLPLQTPFRRKQSDDSTVDIESEDMESRTGQYSRFYR
jgi:hypothetical protein